MEEGRKFDPVAVIVVVGLPAWIDAGLTEVSAGTGFDSEVLPSPELHAAKVSEARSAMTTGRALNNFMLTL
jgi:hypothetical protein